MFENLTPREYETAKYIAEGLSNKLIADRMNVSPHTAKFHVNQVFKRLNAKTRAEVAAIFAMHEALKKANVAVKFCSQCGHPVEREPAL